MKTLRPVRAFQSEEMTDISSDEESQGSIVRTEHGITPRSYQLEMVEESLKRNIIVALVARQTSLITLLDVTKY